MPRLAPFLLASSALHAALLLGGTAIHRVDAGSRVESIAVRLDDGDRGAQSPAPRPAPHNAPEARSADTAAAMPLQTVATSDVDVASAAPGAAAERRPAAPPPGEAAARVQAQVLNDLARHFYYPAIARSRGWEGRVLLAFVVERDGLLRDPRIAGTSGFGILDEAALNSLRKVERVANAGGARLDMQIPVVYRLTDMR